MRALTGLIAFVAMTLLAASNLRADKPGTWYVASDAFRCLIAHALDYAESAPADPVVIVVDACPETDPGKAMAMVSRNSALPVRPGASDNDSNPSGENQVTPIVVFSREELRCLAERSWPTEPAEFIEIPRRPCE